MTKTRTLVVSALAMILVALAISQTVAQENPEWNFYKSTSHAEWLAYDGEFGDVLYRSLDGVNFYRLQAQLQEKELGYRRISFMNPRGGESGKFDYRAENNGRKTIRMNGKTFNHVPLDRSRLKIHDFPEERVPMILVRAADGSYLYVSQERWRENKVRIFRGTLDSMKALRINNVDSWCGGTTWKITTPEGTLDFYTPPGGRRLTWSGQSAQMLRIQTFSIKETETEVSLQPKPGNPVLTAAARYGC